MLDFSQMAHIQLYSPCAQKPVLENILVYLIENVSMETAEQPRNKLLETIYNLGKMSSLPRIAWYH